MNLIFKHAWKDEYVAAKMAASIVSNTLNGPDKKDYEWEEFVSIALFKMVRYRDRFDPSKGMTYRTYLIQMGASSNSKICYKTLQ